MLKILRDTNNTRKVTLTAVFVALGILIPFVTSHAFGILGTVLLPMHLPILLCGFICGMRYGLIAGVVTPCLSSLITGMPAPYPMLPIMLVELTLYGFSSGLLFKRFKLPLFFALPVSMLIGRAGYAVMFYILLALNPAMKALSVWAAVTTGLVGIVVQLVIIPPAVSLSEKFFKSNI
jgi:hypothetical protein